MATASQKLATSLATLKALQDRNMVAIKSVDLKRVDRERLLKNGFIQEVVKGWYVCTRPDETPGESTTWYGAFWSFCCGYLNARFGEAWCVSPEQSLGLLSGQWTIPRQLQIRATKGSNKALNLPHGVSIFDVRLALPSPINVELIGGVRVYKVAAALVACSANQFKSQPLVMRASLAVIRDASEVLTLLLEGGNTYVAGWLAGAFRNVGKNHIADEILITMRSAGFLVNETDPFETTSLSMLSSLDKAPYVIRAVLTWEQMRTEVLKSYPATPKSKISKAEYLKNLEEIYVNDAYNSLSIEGYQVSGELIERVRSGKWSPETLTQDRNLRDTLAARGYWQAFQMVKLSVEKVLDGQNAGSVAKADHGAWYRELFAPSVNAGILKPGDLAGYRNGPVFIRRSSHVPPNSASVRELMPTFFELLRNESEPAVRVVLGHFLFVYIHPYFDGNGRIGRFVMNLMLASGGYGWKVVPVASRNEYMAVLEAASVDGDIAPFAKFLGALS
jgi:hypothetical protein